MATPSIRSVGTVAVDASHLLSLTAPTCSAGDLLVAYMGTNTIPVSPPAGWVTLTDLSSGGRDCGVYCKYATATDTGTSFVFSLTSAGAKGVIIAYKDVIGYDIANSHTYIAGGTSGAVGGGSGSTTRPNELVIELWAVIGTGMTIATAPGVSRVSSNAGSEHVSLQISDQVQSAAGTVTYQTAVWTSGVYEASVATVSLYGNAAPDAPTVWSPPSGSTLDRTAPIGVGWFFSDPDSGDYQTAYDVRWSSDGGSTWHVISATAAVTTPPNVGTMTIPGGTLSAGTISLQVRNTDSHGAVGAYSSTVTFTAATPPAGPTVTTPSSGDTIHDATTNLTWTDTGHTAYRVQVLGDNAGAPDPTNVHYASGEVTDATNPTVSVPLDGTGVDLHIQVAVKASGLWSAYTDVPVHMAWTPPPAPVYSVATFDPSGRGAADSAFALTYNTPAPTGSAPAAAHVDIYVSLDGGLTGERKAANLAASGIWNYYTPASGVPHSFQAIAVAASGVTQGGDWVDFLLLDPGEADSDFDVIDPGGSGATGDYIDGGGA